MQEAQSATEVEVTNMQEAQSATEVEVTKMQEAQSATEVEEASPATVATRKRVTPRLKQGKKEKNPAKISNFYWCVSLLRPR